MALSYSLQLPLPVNVFNATSPAHKHSAAETKKKTCSRTAGLKPLPEPPSSSKRLVPIAEPKRPHPKTPNGKRRIIVTSHSFKKDAHIPESVGSSSEDVSPSRSAMRAARAQKENNISHLDDPHMYDSPDLTDVVKKRFVFKKEEPPTASPSMAAVGPNNTWEHIQYQNLPLQKQPQQQPEQLPDVPPPLPRNPPPSFHPGFPRSNKTTGSCPATETTSPSHQRHALPTPPTKPKSATLQRFQTDQSQGVEPKTAARGMSNPRPANHMQMSELSALFMSRSSADGGTRQRRIGGEKTIPVPTRSNKNLPPIGDLNNY